MSAPIHLPLLVLLSGSTLGSVAVRAQEPEVDQLRSRIESVVRSALADDLHGISLALAFGSDVYVADGWGYADPGTRERADAESLYRAGSLTMQLTAVAVLRLAAQGELSLEDDIAAFFPELAGSEGERSARGISIHDLLAGTSGLPDYARLFERTRARAPAFDPPEVLRWVAGQALEADPGTCFAYSKTNTLLLGLIVERVSELALRQYFERNFFGPLELGSTGYRYGAPTIHEFSEATQEVSGDLANDGLGPYPFESVALCSSALDVLRLTRALVEHDLLPGAFYRRLIAPKRLRDGTETGAGYGVSLTKLDDYECFSFGGGMAGCRLHAAYYPAFDLTIAILASGEAAPVDRIERKLARLVFELPEREVQDLPLTKAERERYTGLYNEVCTNIEILEVGEQLRFVSPYQENFRMLYQGYHQFVSASNPEVRLTFAMGDGKAIAFVLEERGVLRHAVRLE